MANIMARTITPNALKVEVFRKPQKQSRKTYATKLTDTKPRNTRVFKFDHGGVCVSIEVVKPHSKR